MYFIRLDDAAEFRDIDKWNQMEKMLVNHEIKPIFGIIPDCQDPDLTGYPKDDSFWETVKKWVDMGWTPAMHGYQHVFKTNEGGLNPVNDYSEFAGVSYVEQSKSISMGYDILKSHGIKAKIFFAPAHTYDTNTLRALKENTDIRIISDTVADDVYYENDFYFIPQQAGAVRMLPFKITTFCYHPNTMSESDFQCLEVFIEAHSAEFENFPEFTLKKRKKSLYDMFLQRLYYLRHKI